MLLKTDLMKGFVMFRGAPYRHIMNSFYKNTLLEAFATRPTTRLAIKDLLVYGQHMTERKLLKSANYIREQLPIRIAHRIVDFNKLPFVVGTNPDINLVYNLYWNAFDTFRKIPEIKTLRDNEEYCKILREQLKAHLVVLPRLARGLQVAQDHMDQAQLERFLTIMLRSRISRRILAQQHLRLSERKPHEEGHVGILSSSLSAVSLVTLAQKLAQEVCVKTYNVTPGVVIEGHIDATLAGVPEHVQFVLYELLKNALRAVVEKAGFKPNPIPTQSKAGEGIDDPLHENASTDIHTSNPESFVTPLLDELIESKIDKTLPPVMVSIAQSQKYVMFRISDQGSGIPFEALDKIYTYTYTTAKRLDVQTVMPEMAATLNEHHMTPMAGLGFGLTIAKVYAEYLGGTIQLQSMEGYGTDAYYNLIRTAEDQMENQI